MGFSATCNITHTRHFHCIDSTISSKLIIFIHANDVVWVWNVDHYEILARPSGCVWYVGITQDSEDPIHPPHNQWWSPVPLELPAALQHSYKQTAPFLRSHPPQLSWRRSPSCHCCRDTQAPSRLEKARRETQSHLVTFGGGRPETSEHRSFFCVEKSFWAGGLAPRCGHGYALEEYAIRRRRRNSFSMIFQVLDNQGKKFQNFPWGVETANTEAPKSCSKAHTMGLLMYTKVLLDDITTLC